MQIDDITLMAYADGELTPLEAKRIEAAMADDPALAARVARFRAVRRALRTAYDSVAAEPIPEHLRALLGDVASHEPEEEPKVVTITQAREKRAARFGPPAWAVIAASLVVGVIAGRAVLPNDELFHGQAGSLYAGAALTRVLDTQLASATENASAENRVGLTFRTNEGGVCRTFTHADGADALSGVACRENNRWRVRMAVAALRSSGEYQQASANAPEVLALVDQLIAGEPLDAEQERALRDSRWQD